jgi:hypothetical protein
MVIFLRARVCWPKKPGLLDSRRTTHIQHEVEVLRITNKIGTADAATFVSRASTDAIKAAHVGVEIMPLYSI